MVVRKMHKLNTVFFFFVRWVTSAYAAVHVDEGRRVWTKNVESARVVSLPAVRLVKVAELPHCKDDVVVRAVPPP